MTIFEVRGSGIVVARLAMLAAIGAIQSGCARLQAQSRVDPQAVAYYNPGKFDTASTRAGETRSTACPAKIPGDFNGGAVNLDCFYFPEDSRALAMGDRPLTAYARVAGEPDQAKARILRNRLGDILIVHADTICTREMGALVANEGTTNTALSTLDTLFSTTSTIVTGEQAKSILSGLAGAANATRAHINAEVYRNALATAIARAIENERGKQLASIRENLSSKDVGVYTLDQMIRDVNAYHQICSFYRGISLVNDAVDATKPAPETPAGVTQTASDTIDRQIAALEAQKKKFPAQAGGIDGAIATLRNQQADLWTAYAKKVSDAAATK